MFCEKCGTPLDEGTKFCTKCGAVTDSGEEQEIVSQEPVQTTTNSGIYCNNCGNAMSSEDNVCTMCGKAREEMFVEEVKKSPLKAHAVPIAIIALVAIIIFSSFGYAKNAVMKLFLSSDKYLAYVVNSNADDYINTFADNFNTMTDYATDGSGSKAELEFKKGEGLENLLSDVDAGFANEYIEWFESANLNFDVNYKDKMFDYDAGVKVNGVDFGKMHFVVDTNDMMSYFGFPDFSSEYIGTSLAPGYYSSVDYDETTETAMDIINALPNKKDARKLLKKYLSIAVKSIEEVDEESKKITADDISQKVTSLSFGIDEDLMKNISINFLEEVRSDKKTQKIIDDIFDAAGQDSDYFWEMVDQGIEELEDMDVNASKDLATIEIYVNSKGEIVGFEIRIDGEGSFKSFVTEKGNKFGVICEIDGPVKVSFEGNGKGSEKNRTGEFSIKAMGTELANIQVKGLNAKKLKEGLFDGTVTIKCSDAIEALAYTGMVDNDVLDVVSSLGITIKSSQKSFDEANCTITLTYEDEPCAELRLKSNTKKPDKIKVPSDYIDANDNYEIEEWSENFDFDKLIEKMRKANLPDEVIDEMEYAIDSL